MKSIGIDYANAFNTNKRFRSQVIDPLKKRLYTEDPITGQPQPTKEFIEYNDLFKKVYGDDIGDEDDLAAAYGLKKAVGMKAQEVKDIDNEQRKLSAQEAKERRMAMFGNAQNEEQAVLGINNYIKKIISDSKGSPINIKSPTGTTVTYNVPITEDVLNSVVRKDEAVPNAIRYIPREGFKRVYYRTKDIVDDKGKVVGQEIIRSGNGKPLIDETKSTVVPFDQMRVNLGNYLYGGKYLNAIVGTAGKSVEDNDAVVGGSKSSSSSGGFKTSIKRSDIAAKAKAAGYTTEEFTKLLKEKGVQITD